MPNEIILILTLIVEYAAVVLAYKFLDKMGLFVWIAVFSNTPRIVAASIVVYAIVQLLDVRLYHKVWDMTAKYGDSKKGLWIRNNSKFRVIKSLPLIFY